MIKVALILNFDDGWIGGLNYYSNLIEALYECKQRSVEVVIFTSDRTSPDVFKDFPPVKIIYSAYFRLGSNLNRVRRILSKIFKRDVLLELLMGLHDIDVLSHYGALSKKSKIATIAWIPDFQHIHLPEFFSDKEIDTRNKLFKSWCERCDTVLLSSNTAELDLHNFLPASKGRSEVLQFVAKPIADKDYATSLHVLKRKYQFDGCYFLLPNQFWKHKNHLTVIQALGILRKENLPVLVLATGSREDYRHPEYYQKLMLEVRSLNINEFFRPLGVIPRDDLVGLMYNACAIINPSLFEGWSTTVEEAKAINKKMILSDIPVHREQMQEKADFFPPNDAQMLAGLIRKVLADSLENNSEQDRLVAIDVDKHRSNFAKKYQDIVIKTYEKKL